MMFCSRLNKKGKDIFKGGNIEPMQKGLISFEAENLKKAEQYFNSVLTQKLGSSMLMYYEVVEEMGGLRK